MPYTHTHTRWFQVHKHGIHTGTAVVVNNLLLTHGRKCNQAKVLPDHFIESLSIPFYINSKRMHAKIHNRHTDIQPTDTFVYRASRCQPTETFQDKVTTFLCIFYDNAPKIHLQLGQCVMVGRPRDRKTRTRQRETGAAGKGPA